MYRSELDIESRKEMMNERLANFILFANKIVESNQGISKLTNNHEVDQLTSECIDISEFSEEDAIELLRFSESKDAEKVVFLFFILMDVVQNEYFFQKFAEFSYSNRSDFNIYTQYFLYAQLLDMAIRDQYALPQYFHEWIFEISQWYTEYFKEELKPIDYEKRERGLVLVITAQFLGIRHAPTKLTYDICRGIILSGRDLLLINLADALSLTGHLPYWNAQSNYISDYSNVHSFMYEGVEIPFAQCDEGMPNIGMMKELIDSLREMKPELIISIGEDIFSNVIDDMIPVCSIPLQAKLSRNFTKYLVHYNEITSEERGWMAEYGYQEENLVPLKLPFRIEYSDGLKRSGIGIPKEAFCIVAIGNRLETELTEDFLKMLESILNQTNACFLTIGKLDCQSKFATYPHILENNIHLEYTQKLLAAFKLADLYVNPPREGGGTSAIYAMAAGKPIVTLDYGDVYKNCGVEFAVKNIEEMERQIRRYMGEASFYAEMSELATQRAKEYENVEQNISEMMMTLEKREESNPD